MAAREGHGSKEKQRVARALVATYHEAELAGLVEHVAEGIERYRAGELDVHDVDEVIHRYHKATQELWKFCFRGRVRRVRRGYRCDARAPDCGRRATRPVGGGGAPTKWLASAGSPSKSSSCQAAASCWTILRPGS
jgi:hypothetical protein